MKARVRGGVLAAGLLLATLPLALLDLGFLEPRVLTRGLSNAPEFLADFWPPDLAQEDTVAPLAKALWETVEMAYAGTLLGAAVGVPLAILAARTLVPAPLARGTRVFLAFVRTVPALVWALLFVVLFGLGPVPGVLGLAVYTAGYLGKLAYEAFEGLDPDVLEAVRATGAPPSAVVRHAAIPEASNSLLSNLLYAFEYNVRASSVLGFVGAGGIGYYLLGWFQLLEYRKLATAILLLFLLVLVIDAASRFLRRRFLLADGRPAA